MYKFKAKESVVSAIYMIDETCTITKEEQPDKVASPGDWLVVKDRVATPMSHEDFMDRFEPANNESSTILEQIIQLRAQT